MNDRRPCRGVGPWRVVHGHGPEAIGFPEIERAELGLADAGRVLQHSLEHRLQLAW
jgi:hypothetical protein